MQDTMSSHPSAAERNETFYKTFWEDVPDYVRHNPGSRHRRRHILDAIARARAASVLDVGCGDGTLLGLARLARPDIREWGGADISGAQVERMRARFPGVDFYVLDVEKAAIDRTFDVVICSEVIEHLHDQAAAMRNLAAMTKPNGTLVVTCPTGRMYATEAHFGHVRHPTREELGRHAVAAGLRIVSLRSWGWPLYKLLKWATNVNAEWSLRHFANGRYTKRAKLLSDGLYWVNYANKPDDARGCQLFGVFAKLP
jgi:2-polyprenyl-3-methyl-5-hydroxy-6-metoxy-1,4-benzoquinol methylase